MPLKCRCWQAHAEICMKLQPSCSVSQAQQEAISALRCIMVTLSDIDNDRERLDQPSKGSLAALTAAAPSLREALQAARYHKICHVRDAAVPALAELNALVPEPSTSAVAPPALQLPRGRPTRRAASGQKGPWLHQRRSEALTAPQTGVQLSSDAAKWSGHPSMSTRHRRHSSGCDSLALRCIAIGTSPNF
jgi:hypothetical protein